MTNQIKFWLAIAITIGAFGVAAGYIFQAAAINNDRTARLLGIQAQIQQKVSEIAKGGTSSSPEKVQQELDELNSQREGLNKEILFGNGKNPDLRLKDCLLPIDPACFHRNSSEQNNLWVAIAGGVLGAALFLFLRFRSAADANNGSALQDADILLSVVCLIPTGIIVGLLTIFLLRGTKGALLAPVADVVQVENPYGIAFACTIAALFSDRIISWLSKLIDILPSGNSSEQTDSARASSSSRPQASNPAV